MAAPIHHACGVFRAWRLRCGPQHSLTPPSFLVQCCSHEQINGLRELFKSFDKNGDGHITLDELRAGLLERGAVQDGEVEQVWAAGAWVQGLGWGSVADAYTCRLGGCLGCVCPELVRLSPACPGPIPAHLRSCCLPMLTATA